LPGIEVEFGRGLTTMTNDLHVNVRNLTKRFGARLVLNDISLEFKAGETVALVGPSGGGKSTLLRCLNGLNWFDQGEIRVGGHTLGPGQGNNVAAVAQVRRLFGMIFQDFQLFPHLTALQNVIEAPTRVLGLAYQEAVARGRTLLERVGLGGHLHAWPR